MQQETTIDRSRKITKTKVAEEKTVMIVEGKKGVGEAEVPEVNN